jgi:hypothetical protein
MSIPGFTAEASLRQADNRYRPNGDSKDLNTGKGVSPQLPRILNCFCTSGGRYCCCRGDDGKWVCGLTQSA